MDKNVHFIVQPKMSAKERVIMAQRKVWLLNPLFNPCTFGQRFQNASKCFLKVDVQQGHP